MNRRVPWESISAGLLGFVFGYLLSPFSTTLGFQAPVVVCSLICAGLWFTFSQIKLESRLALFCSSFWGFAIVIASGIACLMLRVWSLPPIGDLCVVGFFSVLYAYPFVLNVIGSIELAIKRLKKVRSERAPAAASLSLPRRSSNLQPTTRSVDN